MTEVLWVYTGFSAISVSTKISEESHTYPFETSESTKTATVMILFTNISSPLLLTTSYFSRSFHWEVKKVTVDNLMTHVIYLIVSKNVEIQPFISISNSDKMED